MPPSSPTHSPDFPFRYRLGSAPTYFEVGRRWLFPKHIRARFFPSGRSFGLLRYAELTDTFDAWESPQRRSAKACTTDNNLTYIHLLGPEARPIWLGWPAGSHEQVPPRNFSLLPRERPRNSHICFPGRKLCAGPRRASVLRKRNRRRRKNDIRPFAPRPYPQRRRAYCVAKILAAKIPGLRNPGPRKSPWANPPRSDAGSKVEIFGPEEKFEPKKGLSANEDRLSSLRKKCPASHVAARH